MEAVWNWIVQTVTGFGDDFYLNFVKNDRWKYLTNGLLITLEITVLAVAVGIVLGILGAIVRTTHDHTGKLKLLKPV